MGEGKVNVFLEDSVFFYGCVIVSTLRNRDEELMAK